MCSEDVRSVFWHPKFACDLPFAKSESCFVRTKVKVPKENQISESFFTHYARNSTQILSFIYEKLTGITPRVLTCLDVPIVTRKCSKYLTEDKTKSIFSTISVKEKEMKLCACAQGGLFMAVWCLLPFGGVVSLMFLVY